MVLAGRAGVEHSISRLESSILPIKTTCLVTNTHRPDKIIMIFGIYLRIRGANYLDSFHEPFFYALIRIS